MQQEGMTPDRFTFVPVLNACANLQALEVGRHIHEQVIQAGFEHDVFVGNSLIDMYAKCGSMDDAWRVFKKMPSLTVVSWTTMIFGHVKCGKGHKALEVFQQMQQAGVKPNPVTFVGVLNACASLVALEEGRRAHEQFIRSGFESNVFVRNCLIDMYVKCGSMNDAWNVFNKMPSHSVVSWTAMILGHVKCGQGQRALDLFQQMQKEGVVPDSVTFVGVLNACASVAALGEGRRVHEQIIQSGFESDAFVSSSLIDMYAKCGSMEDAQRVFNKMPVRNAVSWTAMLKGYAMHGQGKEALAHFKWMCEEGADIDSVTFVCVLLACSHAGLVNEGLHAFDSMREVYRIPATVDHYACKVDLLGRAGHLDEAEDVIKTMPCEPNATVWMALLGACRIHGKVELGERIAKQLIELDPNMAVGYVMLSNIYAAAGKWDLSENIQKQRKERCLRKQPGCTWIEVNNEVLHTL